MLKSLLLLVKSLVKRLLWWEWHSHFDEILRFDLKRFSWLTLKIRLDMIADNTCLSSMRHLQLLLILVVFKVLSEVHQLV